MNLAMIAHLGPPGTYSEQAAFFYLNWLQKNQGIEANLSPYATIAQSLQAVATGASQLAVVPVENSIEGSVSMTLDQLWQLESLKIQLALILPISHTLISCATSLESVQTVYSHPQALAQCQGWLAQCLPNVNLIPTNSTTDALERIKQDITTATISSSRAAQLYNLPILASGINDYADNSTRFWVVSKAQSDADYQTFSTKKSHTSLAFSVPANRPGALVKALQIFAQLDINLSRIESRPTKRSLGEYLFFIDIEANADIALMQVALAELRNYTEILKIFGSYDVLAISP
ncbi:prephenate dehydratase [Anabaena cylindrica FACHB-243]|uniref:Prephenate dehydratase n=1 Tax=Anabaena cylindrica (strain ATCC 27899 / PCC 7122) TaxID=272123 RepID=K9ZH89_ANACC|nr:MULTISPECIES: prephenate dehydratase [Anabaena]AFZ57932.1 prephenate dehydratase [Anabaena cylindrica PCC 7122]MBD2419712.1 prephenate dehydratase [Anabaena cylindrica FACHB-243]MBY5281584.1 prephenate dehydratase [Anabaena sp. CCAP 1446/1C]MBY5307162.1 prephenate dehydratase [Anabaena sp. CCAP 1446/1C]MCM2409233.1 prephenate dehydratase [Anabaena sp. CCAP 1446/1C]